MNPSGSRRAKKAEQQLVEIPFYFSYSRRLQELAKKFNMTLNLFSKPLGSGRDMLKPLEPSEVFEPKKMKALEELQGKLFISDEYLFHTIGDGNLIVKIQIKFYI